MKALKFSLMLAIVAACAIKTSSAGIFGHDEKFTKKIEQSYPVDKNTQFEVSNKFGSITIHNWEKAEISIEVVITVEESDKEEADAVFEKIEISIVKEGNIVKAITDIKEKIKDGHFSIDYTVNMPKYLTTNLTNKFGDVIIDELSGKFNITVKYGALRADKLLDGNEKPLSEIKLSYCNSSRIAEIEWAKLDIKYSKIKIEKARALVIGSKYSELDIENSSSIVADAGFDNYRIENVQNLIITAKFTDIEIDNATKKLNLELSYGSCQVNNIPNGFEEIKSTSKYTKVAYGIDKSASYYIDAEASYGDISYPEGNLSVIKEGVHKKVYGWIGNDKNSKSKVSISSEYGEIEVEEAQVENN